MKFDYFTLLNPYPIRLSVGTLIKPKLKDIAYNEDNPRMSFDEFNFYEYMLKLTPELYYTKIKEDGGKEYWESLTEDQQADMSLFGIITKEEYLQRKYVEILNFFFVEEVCYHDAGYFILLKPSMKNDTDTALNPENRICGVISKDIFLEVINAIQQICCIADKEENIEEVKFKNKYAKRMYYKMQKAAKEERERKKADKNLTLPNIISAVSNKHNSITPINVWDLTVFQLLDSFNRLQTDAMYDLNSVRVAVWGDEKKTFDAALWYKNEHDTQ